MRAHHDRLLLGVCLELSIIKFEILKPQKKKKKKRTFVLPPSSADAAKGDGGSTEDPLLSHSWTLGDGSRFLLR